jgi:hypothetical protein
MVRPKIKIDNKIDLCMDMKYLCFTVRPIMSINKDSVCIVEKRYVRFVNTSAEKTFTIDREIADLAEHYYANLNDLN